MIKIGDKEIELRFNYGQLKRIAVDMGCEMHEVVKTVAEMKDDHPKIADFCVLCIFHGSNGLFNSLQEVEDSVGDFSEMQSAAMDFLEQWQHFFKTKSTGEAVAH